MNAFMNCKFYTKKIENKNENENENENGDDNDNGNKKKDFLNNL